MDDYRSTQALAIILATAVIISLVVWSATREQRLQTELKDCLVIDYEVQAGDSLWKLARIHSPPDRSMEVWISWVIKLNGWRRVPNLQPGDIIQLPVERKASRNVGSQRSGGVSLRLCPKAFIHWDRYNE